VERNLSSGKQIVVSTSRSGGELGLGGVVGRNCLERYSDLYQLLGWVYAAAKFDDASVTEQV